MYPYEASNARFIKPHLFNAGSAPWLTTSNFLLCAPTYSAHCFRLRQDLPQLNGDCHEHIKRHGAVAGTVDQSETDRPDAAVKAEGNLVDTRAPAAFVQRAGSGDVRSSH